MSEQVKPKEGFFRRIITSIKDFDKYIEFAVEKIGTSFKYLIKLMLVFSIVISIAFTYKFVNAINRGMEYFKNEIPEIEYKDGKLSVENDRQVILENNEEILQFVVIDVKADREKENEHISKLKNYDNGVVFLEDRMYLKNNMLSEPIEYVYEKIAQQYGIQNFNKAELINYIEKLDQTAIYIGSFITMGISTFLIYLVSTLIDVIMLAVLGFIISRIVGIKIKFQPCFNMAIYALTLPILLNIIYIAINTCTGYTIKYFQWMYSTISYIYMIIAILMIKADFINKQKELMRIVEEQEKVKKEIEERKLKEEEKKQEERKRQEEQDKKEKKERKKEGKDNNLGEEPEGSKA